MRQTKPRGVVVPMVTPVTAAGALDEEAVARMIEFLLKGGVEGIFVLGTTGEAASVPRAARSRFVELAVQQVNRRAQVYAGVNDNCLADAVEAGNSYLQAGVDAVVALLPSYFLLGPAEVLSYCQLLLDRMDGPVILYNIPATTRVSIPIGVLERLAGHPRLIGLKDSEKDVPRLEEILKKFGARKDFAVLIGVGALMARMLLLGADGIVPSAGNLVPGLCRQLCESARKGDPVEVQALEKSLTEVATLYQQGRGLGQSLAALKAAMSVLGLCHAAVWPPLLPVSEAERESIRRGMIRLELTS